MNELQELKNSYQDMRDKEYQLWDFEGYVRRFAAEKMLSQSNSQKMQLEFEKIAQSGENSDTWKRLQQQVKDAQVRHHLAELDYEYWKITNDHLD